MCVDLHTHSLYSDGTDSPEELVRLAVNGGLSGLALTDHDTSEGCGHLLKAGAEAGLRVLTGIEISCLHGPLSLHMLGYGIEPDDRLLQERLTRLQEGRAERNRKILARLNDLGIRINREELRGMSPQGQAGRPHIARLLVDKGVVSSMEQAFHRFLGRGRPAHVKRFCYSAIEAIGFIHQAGGIAVLAHPGQIDPSLRLQPSLVRELAARGLDGLETVYPSHSPAVRAGLERLASRHHLVKTGGSDYHGANRSSGGLATGDDTVCPPDTILDEIDRRLDRIRGG